MGVTFTNNAVAELTGYVSASDTRITINQTAADKFPVAQSGKTWFYATLVDAVGNLEIVKCVNRSYGAMDVIRGQGGTNPREFEAGSMIELRVTANLLGDLVQADEYEDHVTEVEGCLDALVTALNKVE